MSTRYTYLIIDIGAVLVPLIFSFHKKIQFQKTWKALCPAIAISAFLFICWDSLYTYLGVWGFNSHYITGIKLYNLPIEEILFFICIPYACLFTYYCFEKFRLKINLIFGKTVQLVLIILLLVFGLFSFDKLYTCATFISLAIISMYVSRIIKATWLPVFYLMFSVILLPFFIVNGLLTGTGLDEAVVWYNDHENMGIRLLTIPVEDIFYGMLLLLLNTFLFEFFRKRHAG